LHESYSTILALTVFNNTSILYFNNTYYMHNVHTKLESLIIDSKILKVFLRILLLRVFF